MFKYKIRPNKVKLNSSVLKFTSHLFGKFYKRLIFTIFTKLTSRCCVRATYGNVITVLLSGERNRTFSGGFVDLKYRAEIDGLRALAVIPVILFHAELEIFSGGFVGVDVFFVISGYLITTIIIDDLKNKRFSIFNFYERRARRILPTLFFVMLVCMPFAWMWMLPKSNERDFSQSLVAVSLFASNVLFWRESGYFFSCRLKQNHCYIHGAWL